MTKLITAPNLEGHDDLYQEIVDLNYGLSDAASRKANAKLVLLLVNHIGVADVIKEAIVIASQTADRAGKKG